LRHKAFSVVEVRGVEPLSENNSTGPSPGADGYCGRQIRPVPLPAGKPSRLPVRWESSCMARSTLSVRTCTA